MQEGNHCPVLLVERKSSQIVRTRLLATGQGSPRREEGRPLQYCALFYSQEDGLKEQRIQYHIFILVLLFFNPHLRTFCHWFERERTGWGGMERERERNIYQLLLIGSPTGDETRNLGICPDWGLNPQPFGVWDYTPTNLARALF